MQPKSHIFTGFNVTLDYIRDAKIEGDHIKMELADGRILVLPVTREHMELYWSIKLRNRRRAFGLE